MKILFIWKHPIFMNWWSYELLLRRRTMIFMKPVKKLFMLQIWFRIRGFQFDTTMKLKSKIRTILLTRSPNKENNMILLFVIIILLASSFCFANKWILLISSNLYYVISNYDMINMPKFWKKRNMILDDNKVIYFLQILI